APDVPIKEKPEWRAGGVNPRNKRLRVPPGASAPVRRNKRSSMKNSLSRRDLLKVLAAQGIAVLPGGGADAGLGRPTPGWITGRMTGAQALTEALLLEGVCCVFGIP